MVMSAVSVSTNTSLCWDCCGCARAMAARSANRWLSGGQCAPPSAVTASTPSRSRAKRRPSLLKSVTGGAWAASPWLAASHCAPPSIERSSPSRKLPASTMSSVPLARAKTSAWPSLAGCQLCPRSVERKMPSLLPPNKVRPSLVRVRLLMLSPARSLLNSCQVALPSVER